MGLTNFYLPWDAGPEMKLIGNLPQKKRLSFEHPGNQCTLMIRIPRDLFFLPNQDVPRFYSYSSTTTTNAKNIAICYMIYVFICFHMIYVFICFLMFSWLKTIKHPIWSRSDPLPTGCAAGGAPATICPLGPVVDHEQGYQAGTKKNINVAAFKCGNGIYM